MVSGMIEIVSRETESVLKLPEVFRGIPENDIQTEVVLGDLI